ncbi:hypothetical protein [Brachybacterium fresconis]|uniref:Uncharacterized protein n=1 Tax=Brachybacterium fresconis TaxID=173363 RepID=A0ABS4YEV0_9MICO|nr:hypothetical protein [Brachybacterium fresconis]MBP2407313.1 hypothetical protein [Brachybacterium fresconis]
MTTLTFLGLTGGAGTTTLVAMTLLAHPGSERTLPELASHDPATLEQRVGRSFPTVIGDRRITDAGRFTPQKLHGALHDGHAVLVSPVGARGDLAIDNATAHLGQGSRRVLGPHVSVARIAVNGPVRIPRHEYDSFALPYDRLLAHGTPINALWERLGRRTTDAMSRWHQILEDHLWRTQPADAAVLDQLQEPAPEASPWTQPE